MKSFITMIGLSAGAIGATLGLSIKLMIVAVIGTITLLMISLYISHIRTESMGND